MDKAEKALTDIAYELKRIRKWLEGEYNGSSCDVTLSLSCEDIAGYIDKFSKIEEG
jgi:hypothetical protein